MKQIKSMVLLSSLIVMSSCFNDDYDLSDVETTIGVPVNGLEVPINLEKVTLGSVLDIEEGSIIKKSDNGYYLIKDGEFGPSSPIKVEKFTVGGIKVATINTELDLHQFVHGKKMATGTVLGYYDMKVSSSEVKTSAYNVDAAISSIQHVGATACLTVTLKVEGLPSVLKAIHLDNLELTFIKGLEIDLAKSINVKSWDKTTGRLCMEDLTTDSNGEVTAQIYVTGLELGSYNADELKYADHTFAVDAICRVESGRVAVYMEDIDLSKLPELQLPDKITFRCSPELSDIVIDKFSGTIEYDVNNIDVNPVDINDIPDLLSQTGTTLGVANPQIYIELNNPVYNYGLGATARLGIKSERDGKIYSEVVSDEIGIKPVSQNYYCLSPVRPAKPYIYKDKDVNYVAFNTTDILDCYDAESDTHNGLPDKLHIDIKNPVISGTLTNFPLGSEIGPVMGKYSFYAPVELTEKSKIVYAKTFDDWNDEGDLDGIEIDSLILDFFISTDVPYTLDLDIQPLTAGGKVIPGVTVSVPHVQANANRQAITAVVKGKIKALDGVNLKANVAAQSVAQLREDMIIQLENVRAKVYGMYVEYDDK